MKGFKDSSGKFRPTEKKIGVRMKRGKTTMPSGIQVKSVSLRPKTVQKIHKQIIKDLNKGESPTFSSSLNKLVERARLKRQTLATNEMDFMDVDSKEANTILLKTKRAIEKIYPTARSDSVMLNAMPFQDKTTFLHTWENSRGDIVFQMKFHVNPNNRVDVEAMGDHRVIDNFLL